MDAARLGEAERSYARTVALAPTDVEAHNSRCHVLRRLGRAKEALASCEQALRLAPRHAWAWYNKATALTALADAAGAGMEKAVPGDANTRQTQAARLRLQEALASYDRALTMLPRLGQGWMEMSGVLERLGRSQEALAAHERAAQADVAHAAGLAARVNKLGVARFGEGRRAEALHHFEHALQLDPAHADARHNRERATMTPLA